LTGTHLCDACSCHEIRTRRPGPGTPPSASCEASACRSLLTLCARCPAEEADLQRRLLVAAPQGLAKLQRHRASWLLIDSRAPPARPAKAEAAAEGLAGSAHPRTTAGSEGGAGPGKQAAHQGGRDEAPARAVLAAQRTSPLHWLCAAADITSASLAQLLGAAQRAGAGALESQLTATDAYQRLPLHVLCANGARAADGQLLAQLYRAAGSDAACAAVAAHADEQGRTALHILCSNRAAWSGGGASPAAVVAAEAARWPGWDMRDHQTSRPLDLLARAGLLSPEVVESLLNSATSSSSSWSAGASGSTKFSASLTVQRGGGGAADDDIPLLHWLCEARPLTTAACLAAVQAADPSAVVRAAGALGENALHRLCKQRQLSAAHLSALGGSAVASLDAGYGGWDVRDAAGARPLDTLIAEQPQHSAGADVGAAEDQSVRAMVGGLLRQNPLLAELPLRDMRRHRDGKGTPLTLLHWLCTDECAVASNDDLSRRLSSLQLCTDAFPEAVCRTDDEGCTPLHTLCHHAHGAGHQDALVSSLRVLAGVEHFGSGAVTALDGAGDSILDILARRGLLSVVLLGKLVRAHSGMAAVVLRDQREVRGPLRRCRGAFWLRFTYVPPVLVTFDIKRRDGPGQAYREARAVGRLAAGTHVRITLLHWLCAQPLLSYPMLELLLLAHTRAASQPDALGKTPVHYLCENSVAGVEMLTLLQQLNGEGLTAVDSKQALLIGVDRDGVARAVSLAPRAQPPQPPLPEPGAVARSRLERAKATQRQQRRRRRHSSAVAEAAHRQRRLGAAPPNRREAVALQMRLADARGGDAAQRSATQRRRRAMVPAPAGAVPRAGGRWAERGALQQTRRRVGRRDVRVRSDRVETPWRRPADDGASPMPGLAERVPSLAELMSGVKKSPTPRHQAAAIVNFTMRGSGPPPQGGHETKMAVVDWAATDAAGRTVLHAMCAASPPRRQLLLCLAQMQLPDTAQLWGRRDREGDSALDCLVRTASARQAASLLTELVQVRDGQWQTDSRELPTVRSPSALPLLPVMALALA
jgi:ankyrin repeat protein